MSTYEQGFSAGEAHAFKARREHMAPLVRPEKHRDEFERGWWDGYTPRSPVWALRPPSGRPWWADREEEEELA